MSVKPPAGPRDGSASRGAPADLRAAIDAARRNPNLNLGRVVLLEELGRGGMGVVYRGWQDDLRRVVAVKVLPGGTDEKDRARFMREARVASKLRHPNIVPVHEAGEAGGRCYFTMDLVEGGSFQQVLREKRFDLRTLCEKVRLIALALEHAHKAGIVHRDIKPANVLVAPDGTPFLTDFGLAQDASALTRLTMSGAIMGTPAYMSPEQAEGRTGSIDARTDIYSLGAVLYEGLTGHTPVEGSDIAAMIWSILRSDPARPSTRVPGIPRDVETICLKCLEKDAARRYATAGDLARDLQHFLDKESIEAVPPGTLTLWWLRAKRRPLPYVVGTASVLLLTAIAAMWAQGVANKENMEAKQRQMEAEAEKLKRAEEETRRVVEKSSEENRKRNEALAAIQDLQLRHATSLDPGERGRILVEMAKKFAELGVGAVTLPETDPGTGHSVPPAAKSPWPSVEAHVRSLVSAWQFATALAALDLFHEVWPAERAKSDGARLEVLAAARKSWRLVEREAERLTVAGKFDEADGLLGKSSGWSIPEIDMEARAAAARKAATEREARRRELQPRVDEARRKITPLLQSGDLEAARAVAGELRAGAEELAPDADSLERIVAAVAAYPESAIAGAAASPGMKVRLGSDSVEIVGATAGAVRIKSGAATTTVPLDKLSPESIEALAVAGKAIPASLGLARLFRGQLAEARKTWAEDPDRPALDAIADTVASALGTQERERQANAAIDEAKAAAKAKQLGRGRAALLKARGFGDTEALRKRADEIALFAAALVEPGISAPFVAKPSWSPEGYRWTYDFSSPQQARDWPALSCSWNTCARGNGARTAGGGLWTCNTEARFLAPLEGEMSISCEFEYAGREDRLVGVGLGAFGAAVWNGLADEREGVVISPTDSVLRKFVPPAVQPGTRVAIDLKLANGRFRAVWNGQVVFDDVIIDSPRPSAPGLFVDQDTAAVWHNVRVTGTPRAGWTDERAAEDRDVEAVRKAPGNGVEYLKPSSDGKNFGLFRREEDVSWTKNDDGSLEANAIEKDSAPAIDTSKVAELHADADDAKFRNARITFDYRLFSGAFIEICARQGFEANPRWYLPCDRPHDWLTAEIILAESSYDALVYSKKGTKDETVTRLLAQGPRLAVGAGGIRIKVRNGRAAFRNFRVQKAQGLKAAPEFEELLKEGTRSVTWSEGWVAGTGAGGGMELSRTAGESWVEFTIPAGDAEILFGYDVTSDPRAKDPLPLPTVRLAVNGADLCAERLFKHNEPRGIHMLVRGGKAFVEYDRWPIFSGRDVGSGPLKVRVWLEGPIAVDTIYFRKPASR
ncbi:MAG: tetratricopeptide repeat protein kinase family [Planctomycetota bacterium]|nr:MAG: tetratricopeptide repeat protein kinase family [Planctomycetota bacterium]